MRSAARWIFAAVLAAAPMTGAVAQRLGGDGAPEVSILRVFLSLFACLVIAVGMMLFLRQKMRGGARFPLFTRIGASEQQLQLIETRRIAPQADLCLIACRGTEYLVLIAPGGTQVLSQHAASDPSDPA